MKRSTTEQWSRLIGTAALAGLVLLYALPAFGQSGKSPTTAPRNPDFERFVREGGSTRFLTASSDEFTPGLVPSPVDLSHNRGRTGLAFNALGDLPSRFDLRTQSPSKLTGIRNQSTCGSCWAFGTYGSMESCLLPGETWDFSENHVKNTHGFDWTCCEGGNVYISTAYLARWSGPVADSSDPHNPSSCTSPPNLTVLKHIQNVDFLPDRAGSLDNDTIKQAIMEHGAVYTTFYWSGGYYNSTSKGYYYSGTSLANHAVCFVGWDDNYDKSNFLTTPAGNGAFIIKNSWGPGWGEGGYFYISYYDKLIGRENAVFDNAESVYNYNQIFQYDTLGWCNSLGYTSTTGWFANIFTAGADTDIKAVSLYAASPGSPYEVKIYLSPDSGPLSTSGAAGTQTGTLANAGYQTIVLDTPVRVAAGQKFSVAAKLTTPGYNYPVPIEEPYQGYSSAATANSGESYISGDGTTWTDITADFANTNVCLKAFGGAVGDLVVSPGTGFVSSGPVGGQFSPVSQGYTLLNNSALEVGWTASKTTSWLSLSSTGGTLAVGGSADFAVSINSMANALQPGVYYDTVSFTNTTSGSGSTARLVTLTVYADYEIRGTTSSWIDPSAHAGFSLTDDGVSPAQAIPFEFKLYEKPYAQLYAAANGMVGFINQNLTFYSNTDLPAVTAPNATLYPYWDDLNPGAGGSIRVGTVGLEPNRKFVVSWVGVPPYGAPDSPLSFQVVLCEGSDDVIFNYLNVQPSSLGSGAGRGATIGIENEKGTSAAVYSINGTRLLHDSQSVLYTSRGPSVTSIKMLPDGALAAVRRAIVTAAFGDDFYIESDDRLCGIRVHAAGSGLTAGSRADVAGALAISPDGERYIDATSVALSGQGSVAPIGLTGAIVGGSDFAYDPGTGSGQAGTMAWRSVFSGGASDLRLVGILGPNNIGLLVRMCGRVTYADADGFYLDDGFGAKDAAGHVGVRILASGLVLPSEGEYCSVTGVVSCYKVDGVIYRMIRLDDQDDILIVSE